MAISLARYVLITSGVGAAAIIGNRNLNALVISANNLIPTNSIVVFNNAADVGTYFGTASEEYARALFYFGWTSKNINACNQLSFYFYNSNAATASLIFGSKTIDTLSQFNAISTGDFTLTLGGFTHHLTAINLTAAGSLAAVAADIQTAIRAFSGGGAAWTGATVTYDSTNGRFDLVSGATGLDTVSVAAGVTTELAGPLGWLAGAVLSNGQAAQSITQNLNALIALSNNFGSFCYTDTLSVTQQNIVDAATWNKALTPNIQFMYSQQVSVANAAAWGAAVLNIGGCTLTLQSPGSAATTEYPEMSPMMILGATDYTKNNSVQNYMYQIFNLTPSVTTDADANTYDNLRINYYGQTQSAGQLVQFYQRGFMMGLPVDPSDQNTYANEIWFKDALGTALINILLALAQLAANATGRAQVLSVLQGIINNALGNGTVSVGKTLTVQQQLYISQISASPTAWQQVQNIGYWVNVVITPYTANGVTQYKAVYTLIYSKDDVIRLITGSNVLI